MKLIFICFLFPVIATAQSWSASPDFPATERDDGAGFVIDGKAYCGTGLTPWWSELSDFYVFGPEDESWNSVSSLPEGEERQYATGFSDSSSGFIFGGVAGGVYKNDLWQYNPEWDEWNLLAPMPASGRSGSAVFVLNETAFIIGGRNDIDALTEVWAYHIPSAQWTQKNDFPFGGRWRASAASVNEKGYLLFGLNEDGAYQNELFEYDPAEDSWTIISTFPTSGRTHAAMQPMGNHLLIFGGVDSTQTAHNDFYQFDTENQEWELLAELPEEGRRGGISFTIANSFFYTTGITTSGERLKETWRFDHPTSTTDLEIMNVEVYPNPGLRCIHFKPSNAFNGPMVLSIYNADGQLIQRQPYQPTLDISHLEDGIYILSITGADGKSAIRKLVKQ